LTSNSVTLRTTTEGLVVVFDSNEGFESIYSQIEKKFEASSFFFKGTAFMLWYRGRKLSKDEEKRVARMVVEKTGAKVAFFEIDPDFAKELKKQGLGYFSPPERGSEISEHMGERERQLSIWEGSDTNAGDENKEDYDIKVNGKIKTNRKRLFSSADPDSAEHGSNVKHEVKRHFSTDLNECMTKFHRGTMRSGKLICYDGNVVVLGDVNPGAEVEASGNIVIVGALKGTVHAGASGNRNASVIALNISPAQLKIADLVSRRPDRKSEKKPPLYSVPEIAYIRNDTIVTEMFLTQIRP